SVREQLEPRFGHDFGNVRIHTDGRAAQTARDVSARAYTVGGDIAFASGEYAPATTSGMHLLAHELTHTIQQGASVQRSGWTSTSTAAPAIQRTRAEGIQRTPTISVMDENFVGPPSASQRRAEKSCPINCCHTKLGTLHAMPLFYSVSRGSIVAAGSASATGVGAALHFIKESAQPPAGDVCHCDDMRMIQIVTSNVPSDPRGNNSFVDNGNVGTSPFYGDTGLTGRGEHTIDPRFVDAGERIKTDESIYDIPFRDPAILGTTDFSWMAETCVACIKNTGPDRILGCVTYGFTRHYNPATSSFDPIVAVSPSCQNTSTASFRSTLRTDPTTTAYDFEGAPGPIECGDAGDYPMPRGDTRYA
ncbi:MAG: DUF4157 domain-containing protein, partial [Bacteroidetes bacterium]|nr:DUF4157 domain-containing protein [Bacteroidota bacterium]